MKISALQWVIRVSAGKWRLFVLSFFPLDVLDEIWDVIESVSEGFLTYSCRRLISLFSCWCISTANLLFGIFQLQTLVTLGVPDKFRVVTVKRLPADYKISRPLGSKRSIWVILKIAFCFIYCPATYNSLLVMT